MVCQSQCWTWTTFIYGCYSQINKMLWLWQEFSQGWVSMWLFNLSYGCIWSSCSSTRFVLLIPRKKNFFTFFYQLFVYIFILFQVVTVNTEIVNVTVWRLIQDWNTDLKRWPIFKINPYYISHFVYFVTNNVWMDFYKNIKLLLETKKDWNGKGCNIRLRCQRKILEIMKHLCH